jgi:hypothetical protein
MFTEVAGRRQELAMSRHDPQRFDPFNLSDADLRFLTEKGRRERALAVRSLFRHVFRAGTRDPGV